MKGEVMKPQWEPVLVIWLFCLLAFLTGPDPTFSQSKTWNFDKDKVQALPSGWISELTGQGVKGTWLVVPDSTAPSKPNVLAQTSTDATDYRFPLAIVEDTNYKDLDLSVRVKAISGRVDQGGGLVWRYRNANNYYIVRANALEDNVVLYKVENGKRTHIKPRGATDRGYGVKIKVPGNVWNTLSVKVRGGTFEVYFNGQKLYDVDDTTFTEAGKIGLWTKADSVIHFDELTVEPK
jgi:hypothetical protein